MKKSDCLWLIGIFALLMGSWTNGQDCRDMTYANKNQVETGLPFKIPDKSNQRLVPFENRYQNPDDGSFPGIW